MKVFIWGHLLHSHTHSYIHESFTKAFARMGHDVAWLPDSPRNQPNLDGALVITEGQVDKHLPVHPNCHYVLHNCQADKYADVSKKLLLQVYTHDTRDRAKDNPTYEKLAPCTYIERAANCNVLYQPWATDLMPDEIDLAKAELPREKVSNWVGTIGNGRFGNDTELVGFQAACIDNKIRFQQQGKISTEEHRRLIEESFLAPAIVGYWQKEKGYIPCRIFKNISYGQLGVTNSESVVDVMQGNVVYNPDSYHLFNDAIRANSVDATKAAMEFVRKNHTYVNRIQTILNCLGL